MKRSALLALVAAVASPIWILGAGPAEKAASGESVAKPKAVTPPSTAEIDAAVGRGVDFLLKVQNKNGSWGSATQTKALNIFAPVPGAHHAFRTAVTGLCIAALIDMGGDQEAVRKSIERGEQWMFDNLLRLRRADPTALYNVWGHAYAIQALVRMHDRVPGDAERQEKIKGLIRDQFDFLSRYESIDGGWGYYDFDAHTRRPNSKTTCFTSATVLFAFYEAKQLGLEPPKREIDRAIASILRQQKPDFTYLYGEYLRWQPMRGINRPGGSLGRSQACNLVLKLWDGDDKITEEVFTVWLDRLFTRNGWLDIGRKRPVPHEAWFQVAGYFFYFGHYYAAHCIDQLAPENRPFYQDQLAHLLLKLQEKDGSWWDYPLYNYHQQYGTAFALMSLKQCIRRGPIATEK